MPETRQCAATSKQTGQRCRLYATPGAFVCRFHGGNAPQVRAAAASRLATAEAEDVVRRLLDDPGAAPVGDAVVALAALAGRMRHVVDRLGDRESAEAAECGRGERLPGDLPRGGDLAARPGRAAADVGATRPPRP